MAGATCTVDFFTGIGLDGGRLHSARARGARAPASAIECWRRPTNTTRRPCDASACPTPTDSMLERLAGAILVAEPGWRARAGRDRRATGAASRRCGASASRVTCRSCWFGSRPSEARAAAAMARAHAFWRAFGVADRDGDRERRTAPARAATGVARRVAAPRLPAELLGKPGGVFLLTDRPLDDGDRLLLSSPASSRRSARSTRDAPRRLRARRVAAPRCRAQRENGARSSSRPPGRCADVDSSPNGLGGLAGTLDEYVVDHDGRFDDARAVDQRHRQRGVRHARLGKRQRLDLERELARVQADALVERSRHRSEHRGALRARRSERRILVADPSADARSRYLRGAPRLRLQPSSSTPRTASKVDASSSSSPPRRR